MQKPSATEIQKMKYRTTFRKHDLLYYVNSQQHCPTTTAPPKSSSTPCGSRGIAPCAPDQYCIADPNNLSCSLIADCLGLCVKLDGPACGGFAGLKCLSADLVCVDDPRDDCGGPGSADCIGICVRLDGTSANSGI